MSVTIDFSILIVLAVFSSDAKHLKCIPVCPDCAHTPEDIFAQFALRYLNGNGSTNETDNGTCEPGNYSPQCPISPLMGPGEPIEHFWQRIGRRLKGAPTNGCCPEGTFRWMLTEDVTNAVADGSSNDITDPIVDLKSESSSSSTRSSEEK